MPLIAAPYHRTGLAGIFYLNGVASWIIRPLQSDSPQNGELRALTSIRAPNRGVPRPEVSDRERGSEGARIVSQRRYYAYDTRKRGEPPTVF